MKNILVMIVTVTIGIIFAGSLLAPVIDDVSATEKTFTNDGYYHVMDLDSDSEYKLFWDHTNPYQITLNDTDVIEFIGLTDYQAVTLLACDKFCIRFFNVSDNPRIQLYGGTGWGFGGASVTAGTDFTVIITGGNVSITNTATENPLETTNAVPDKLYGVSTTGPYVMKKANSPAYVLEDTSVIVLCGLTEGGGLSAGVYAEGTIDGGLDYTLFRPAAESETAIFSNEVITSTAVDGYIGLSSLTKVEFDVTLTGGTLEPTYTYFIVPAQVTAELSQHLDDGEIAILAAIPLMAIAALVLLVVRYFVAGRD